MKTTEQYFQEFYNEVRYQIEQGSKANFTRANQIWAEYEAAQQSVQLTGLCACKIFIPSAHSTALVCRNCGKPHRN